MFWNKKLHERIKELEEEYIKLNKSYQTSLNVNALIVQEKQNVSNELTEVKNKLRTETEADIFFSCAKIQKRLLDGEPKENVSQEIAYRNAMMNNLAQQQQQQQASPYNFLGNFLSQAFSGRF